MRKMVKPHLLIYAHYYIPDIASTGQLLQELAENLLSQFKVTVICVVPSYLGTIEEKYKKRKLYYENINGVQLIRVRVPEFSKSNKISRIKNIISYFFSARRATNKIGDVDYVMAISQPPILGGMLGAYCKRKTKAKYCYWLQDCNPEQIETVGYFKFKPLLKILKKIDMNSCSKTDLIIVPGRDMVETIRHRYAKCINKMPNVAVVNNWINENEIYPLEDNCTEVERFKKEHGLYGKYIISYSGNLGNYYSLPELLQVIEKFPKGTKTPLGKDVVFTFIGDGAQKANMQEHVKRNKMENVIFIPYQNKENLIYSLNATDVHWCVNAKGIKGISCPSKYYGIAAAGKPVLAVLEKDTEIRCVIEECNGGLVCEPEDYEGIERNIKWFIENDGKDEVAQMGLRGRKYLEEHLTREGSIAKFEEEIKKI